MIPLKLTAEPKDFNDNVRIKGNSWIKANPHNNKFPAYWTQYLPNLATCHNHICCYYNIYIEPACGADTIDHFSPKSKYPNLVYDWGNYRYCSLEANRQKHTYEDVIDPATLPLEAEKHTFEIDFSDGSVRPNPSLSSQHIQMVNTTIERLKMNDVRLRENRMDYLSFLLQGEISQAFLNKRAPFVYSEAERQNYL